MHYKRKERGHRAEILHTIHTLLNNHIISVLLGPVILTIERNLEVFLCLVAIPWTDRCSIHMYEYRILTVCSTKRVGVLSWNILRLENARVKYYAQSRPIAQNCRNSRPHPVRTRKL